MARRIAAFIRHGAYHQLEGAPSALQPYPLTQAGAEQVLQAAIQMQGFLKQNDWHVVADIQSSSLLRAWQTAALFSEQFNSVSYERIQITSVDALAERSVGSAANLTVQQIAQLIDQDPRFDALPNDWKSDSHFRLPLIGAESLLQAGERVANHVSSTMENLPVTDVDQVQLFFGHGAAFRHAAYQLGVIPFEEIAALSMYHASPVYIEYLAGGRWRHIAGEWKVRAKQTAYTD